MDGWLRDNLVCPRDKHRVRLENSVLVCQEGHKYPFVDGIPVMLLEEVRPTHGACCETLEKAGVENRELHGNDDEITVGRESVDPYVQKWVWATCGIMYKPLVNKLSRYPIPEFPLPKGSGQILLDIGCNWGRWCISAAQKGYSCVGIDPSLDAIKAARRVARQFGLQINYLVADARYLPFTSGSLDVAFSYSVLQHFDKRDVRLSLAEVARVLRATGISFIQMPNILGPRNMYNQLRRGFKQPTSFQVRFWSLSELESIFNDLIGPTSLSVDGYFSLNARMSDMDMLPSKYRPVVLFSEMLRRMSGKIGFMKYLADSLYVKSSRKGSESSAAL